MKKGLIAFAIYFACTVIAAALNTSGLLIIPEGEDVSLGLVLATHLPAWLYLISSKSDALSGMFAFYCELFARILITWNVFDEISVFNASCWMLVILRLYLHEKQEKWHCDLKKDGEPCEFCAFRITENEARRAVEERSNENAG